MRFGDPGNPVKEECNGGTQTYFRRRWCFGGKGGGHWGSSFEIGGSAVVRTTILGCLEGTYGTVARTELMWGLRWGGLGGEWCPNRPSGHPRGDTFECRCGTACGCG